MAIDSVASKILLIENDDSVARMITAALRPSHKGNFSAIYVIDLAEALECLRNNKISAIILDLMLPDSKGIETFNTLFAAAPSIPILILASRWQQALALQAVQSGATDYLFPEHLDGYSLPRALCNAIDREAAKETLFVDEERSVITLNSIGDAVLCTDMGDKVSYLNLVAERMTGWSQQEAYGRSLGEVFRIIDGVSRNTAQNPMKMAIRENHTVALTANCVLIRRDGREFAIEDSTSPIHDRDGSIVGAVIVFHDVSAARAMSLQMTHMAEHDLVTNLPNRLLLKDRITQAAALARRRKASAALLFLDLDQFKNINDSWGHAVGDEVLRSVSQRLSGGLRASDTVSRLGGDEFVILLSEINEPADAATCAKKILLLIAAPYFIEDHTIFIGGSIGISVFPRDGESPDTLIQNADTAMYEAKKRGRNGFRFFNRDMNLKAIQRQSIEASLRLALERNEFLLHYQPKVELNTGEITGAEALIRWNHPETGLIPPLQFIPIAEDSGLIVQIGRWVLREACEQVHSWQKLGHFMLPISVNVSAVEFRHKGFVQHVKETLEESGLAARYLQLELTERVLMRDVGSTSIVLQELKQMGIQLAVDDFGTGYSSLSYLRQFPIDVLKIDQTFVSQITGNADSATIASTIIDMGKNFKHRVVAEGIETEEQRAYLQHHHCAEGQGYLFSPPVDASHFTQLLESGMTLSISSK